MGGRWILGLGYHELSDGGDGFFRHEVLFAAKSTILVEFKTVDVRSDVARKHSK